MAHLTITSGTAAGAGVSKAFGGQAASAQDATSEPGGLMGLFAALLDSKGATGAAAGTTAGAQAGEKTDFDLAALLQMGLGGADADKKDQDADKTDALAAEQVAAGQAVQPLPRPMVEFIDALTELKTSLDSGKPIDAKLLDKVGQKLEGLADALGLKLDDLSVPKDFAALLEGASADGSGLAGTLGQLLAPLAQALDGSTPNGDAQAAADVSGALKSLGDKLAALMQALEDGDVPADKLAALGMKPGEAPDAEIEAALTRFAESLKADTAKLPQEPALASASLKLTDPALTGKADSTTTTDKSSDATAVAARPAVEAKTSGKDAGTRDPGQDADRSRDRADAAAARQDRMATATPAATDASNTPAPSAADAGAQQAQSMRVDAAANPRIVQTGYQTSQQQLNLPQIAFEMARQVQDGNTRFQIRLDPPELGRIDVRLEIDRGGQVHARLTVEKAETLDLMQRDQRGLERALQQAGLDTGKTNLEFSLKQNPFAGQAGQFDQRGNGNGSAAADAAGQGLGVEEADQPAPQINLYRGSLQASGVNIIA